jgi:hypothetical protein
MFDSSWMRFRHLIFGVKPPRHAASSLSPTDAIRPRLLHRYHHQGDTSAFAALVKTHAGMAFGTAERVTCDVSLAEEVAQDVFVALARSGHRRRIARCAAASPNR